MKEKKKSPLRLNLKPFYMLCFLSFAFYFLNSCGIYQSEKNLDSESKEFLTKVRYLITGREYKIFMNLPPSERIQFREEFWKMRDPDPSTQENEFKNSYFSRIENANKLFGVGRSGFYTDRGMIYVLFGPPDDIHKSQIFARRSGSDEQVWLYTKLIDKYSNVRIYFVDRIGTGDYELVRNSSIQSILQEVKLYYLTLAAGERFFPYDLNIKTIREAEDEIDLLIQIEIPYKNIWFSSTEDRLETSFTLEIEILDESNNKIWEIKKDHSLSFSEKEIAELFDQDYLLEIPLTLTKGSYSLKIIIIPETGKKEERHLEFHV
jgi:GWxTD domain-containing protein